LSSRARRILLAIVTSLVTTTIVFSIAEGAVRIAYFVRNSLVTYVPLPYVMGDDYGPIPPWLDSLLILQPDEALIWKSAPHAHRKYVDIFSPVWRAEDRVALLRRFLPTLPAAFRANPVWEISLNSNGDRSPEIATAKRPSGLRIACVGDSWTFGMNVNQDRTYPSRVAELLHEKHPSADAEVVNLGVLGYSSFQGLQLLKRRALDLNADVFVIGFGMNDSEVAGYRDKDIVAKTAPTPLERLRRIDVAEHLEFYKLLKYFALVLRYRPQSMAAVLTAEAEHKGSGAVHYEDLEPWVRVSPPDYERNIREMIRLARSRGAKAILVDNELWDQSPYRPVLRAIARDEQVPLVDSLRIIADARKQIEQDLETRLSLTPPAPGQPGSRQTPSGETEVVFRVYAGPFPVPKTLSIVGAHARLGALVPNKIALRDDGTGGDQKPGDNVWSYSATFPVGTQLFYVYTNSGREGQWEGLDVPAVRHLDVTDAPGGRLYPPIESFGKIYMQADNWHTDAVGYDLIAEAVVKAIGLKN